MLGKLSQDENVFIRSENIPFLPIHYQFGQAIDKIKFSQDEEEEIPHRNQRTSIDFYQTASYETFPPNKPISKMFTFNPNHPR